MRRLETRRALWGFAITLAILCAVNAISFHTLRTLRNAAEARKQSQEFTRSLDALHMITIDAETAQRGFVITGDEAYLSPYHSAVAGREKAMEHLRLMADVTHRQRNSVQRLRQLVHEKFAVVQRTIEARRNGGFETAVAILQGGEGKRIMDQIRDVVAASKAREAAVLQREDEVVQAKTRTAFQTLLGGTIASILVMLVAGAALLRASRERERAARLLETAHNELEQKVRERTAELAASNAQLQQEIVQRRDAESEAQRQKQFLNAVLDSMQEAIVACDASGQITLFNRASRELHGVGEQSISPGKWAETDSLFEPDGITPLSREKVPLYRALHGESLRDAEMVISPTGGEKRFVLASGQPIKSEGNGSLGAVVAMRDVTELRQAQESRRAHELADAANRAKSEFLSRMSHELRTPLNAILGFAQVLELDKLSADQQDSVNHIIKGGRHLLSLINEVLDISRIEAGRLALSPEPVLLDDAIREAVDFVGPMARQRNIDITVAECEGPQCYVHCDRQRIKQVLLNLLSNAVKYNRENGSVTVSFSPTPEKRFRISISDTGRGISPDKINRLFIPFERLGAEQSLEEGTGLGLALSRKLVELMGGQIGVDSQPGEGSTFWFELPQTEAPLQSYKEEVTQAPVTNPLPGRALSVLYIEDNLSNVRLIERLLLQRPQVNLLSALSGEAGIEIARKHQPDLIFLDLNLPDMHGSKVLDELVADDSTRDKPIIIISADASPGQLERLLQAGARAYLTKPIDVAQFLRLLDQAEPAQKST